MAVPQPDTRSERRKLDDERIATEPALSPPDVAAALGPKPVEEHLQRLRRRPVAVMGVVENGLVRPIDPSVSLPERSRVIIVTSEIV